MDKERAQAVYDEIREKASIKINKADLDSILRLHEQYRDIMFHVESAQESQRPGYSRLIANGSAQANVLLQKIYDKILPILPELLELAKQNIK